MAVMSPVVAGRRPACSPMACVTCKQETCPHLEGTSLFSTFKASVALLKACHLFLVTAPGPRGDPRGAVTLREVYRVMVACLVTGPQGIDVKHGRHFFILVP